MSMVTIAEAQELAAHASSYDRDTLVLATELVRRSPLPIDIAREALNALDARAEELRFVIDPWNV